MSRHQKLLLLIAAAIIAAVAVSLVAVRARSASSADLSGQTSMPLTEGWQLRWGDSPRGGDGTPQWLVEPFDAPGWTRADGVSWGNLQPVQDQYVWLRVRLPRVPWKTTTLYVPHVIEAFEVYLDRERIYTHGAFAPDRDRYASTAVHIISLGDDCAGRILTLRVHSSLAGQIGFEGYGDPITIGSNHGVMESIIRRSLETSIFGAAACFLGLVSLLVSFRRFHRAYPAALGMFSLLIGFFFITLAPASSLAIPGGALRYYAHVVPFLTFPIWLYVFVELTLEGSRIVRALWMVHVVTAALLLAGDATGVVSVTHTGSIFSIIFAATIMVMLVVAVRSAFSGNYEARVLLAGLVVMGIAGINDLLIGIGVIPYWHWISPVGTSVFIVLLVYIADRRFSERALLLKSYSQQLEQKSEQLAEYAETLEQKVRERTRDLDAKNTELARTLEELRSMQQQLVMREKMASLGNLVAGVAHEVNNPVGAITSAADASNRCIRIIDEFVQGHGGGNDRVRKAITILGENNELTQAASRRVTGIVRSLRSFSRLDEAEYQTANIHEGIDSTLTLVYHQTKNRIEVEREYGDIPAIDCYPNQLNQVFMNLLVNAAQAIEGPGRITIRTWRDGDHVCVSVHDTGRGILPEHIGRLFDPGFTTKGVGVGTGLGLSISYRIIQDHRGSITVESEPGQGTTFTIRLPISAQNAT